MIIMTVVDDHGGLCFSAVRARTGNCGRGCWRLPAPEVSGWIRIRHQCLRMKQTGSIRPMIFSNRQAAVISALSKIRRCFPMQTVSNRLSYSAGTGHIRLICILTLLWIAPGNCRKVMIFPDFPMILLQKRYM